MQYSYNNEVMRRVRLANSMNLLECTDAELRELMGRRRPDIDDMLLCRMGREEIVSLLLDLS